MDAPATVADFHEVRRPPGRRGSDLALAITYPRGRAERVGAVVSSPLPFLGGDMGNNVVRALALACAASGLPALRYDYRSVGASRDVDPGSARFETWRRVEETGDRSAVLVDADEAWRRATQLFAPGLLCGYSFGCWTAVQMHVRAAATGPALPLLLVAPPLDRFHFAPLAAHPAPVLLLFAGDDELTPAPDAAALRGRLPHAHAEVVAGADHFFRGCEGVVDALARRFIERHVTQCYES